MGHLSTLSLAEWTGARSSLLPSVSTETIDSSTTAISNNEYFHHLDRIDQLYAESTVQSNGNFLDGKFNYYGDGYSFSGGRVSIFVMDTGQDARDAWCGHVADGACAEQGWSLSSQASTRTTWTSVGGPSTTAARARSTRARSTSGAATAQSWPASPRAPTRAWPR